MTQAEAITLTELLNELNLLAGEAEARRIDQDYYRNLERELIHRIKFLLPPGMQMLQHPVGRALLLTQHIAMQ